MLRVDSSEFKSTSNEEEKEGRKEGRKDGRNEGRRERGKKRRKESGTDWPLTGRNWLNQLI